LIQSGQEAQETFDGRPACRELLSPVAMGLAPIRAAELTISFAFAWSFQLSFVAMMGPPRGTDGGQAFTNPGSFRRSDQNGGQVNNLALVLPGKGLGIGAVSLMAAEPFHLAMEQLTLVGHGGDALADVDE